MLPLYGADDTLLDSPGSFFRVMSCSPKFADSPGSSSGRFSPFSNHIASKIGMRNIWFLKDKQAVVEEYEQQGEPSFKVFCANYNNPSLFGILHLGGASRGHGEERDGDQERR